MTGVATQPRRNVVGRPARRHAADVAREAASGRHHRMGEPGRDPGRRAMTVVTIRGRGNVRRRFRDRIQPPPARMAQHARARRPFEHAAEMAHLAGRAGVPARQREPRPRMVEPELARFAPSLRREIGAGAEREREPDEDGSSMSSGLTARHESNELPAMARAVPAACRALRHFVPKRQRMSSPNRGGRTAGRAIGMPSVKARVLNGRRSGASGRVDRRALTIAVRRRTKKYTSAAADGGKPAREQFFVEAQDLLHRREREKGSCASASRARAENLLSPALRGEGERRRMEPG